MPDIMELAVAVTLIMFTSTAANLHKSVAHMAIRSHITIGMRRKIRVVEITKMTGRRCNLAEMGNGRAVVPGA